ncbi:hepatocellular carcinoma-associated antigen 59-domain-containing protein [Phlyctochytrium arcticum]|nr:hepatocellular carcinoma-associated antigen 59-domain-containing protein [Phlyctochytrium arcticum]
MPTPKTRRYRKKDLDDDDAEPKKDLSTSADHTTPETTEEDVSTVLQEALELRKFRRKAAGIDASDLNRGEPKKKKKEKVDVEDDPWKLKSGGGIIDINNVRGRSFGEEGMTKEVGSFATESNAMDTERHMQEYIEEELRKKRGSTETVPDAAPVDIIRDFHDELYRIPAHLQANGKPVSEGNVTLSTAMLTAIPEIDLGMNTKLKNIEATEKEKRKLLEKTAGIDSSSNSGGPKGDFGNTQMVIADRCKLVHPMYDLIERGNGFNSQRPTRVSNVQEVKEIEMSGKQWPLVCAIW